MTYTLKEGLTQTIINTELSHKKQNLKKYTKSKGLLIAHELLSYHKISDCNFEWGNLQLTNKNYKFKDFRSAIQETTGKLWHLDGIYESSNGKIPFFVIGEKIHGILTISVDLEYRDYIKDILELFSNIETKLFPN